MVLTQRFPVFVSVLACLFVLPSVVYGQITVQLPTFSVFNIDTTVMVPDGGEAVLGGVKSYSAGRTSRGVPGLSNIPGAGRLFRNEGIGSETANRQTTVRPQIIIASEMETEMMARAGFSKDESGRFVRSGLGAKATRAAKKKASFLSKHMGKSKRPPR